MSAGSQRAWRENKERGGRAGKDMVPVVGSGLKRNERGSAQVGGWGSKEEGSGLAA